MSKVRTYRDLIAWQLAMRLARTIYIETRHMPREERFGLTAQIRRAAVSVPSNIAEGFGRQSRPDLVRFLRQARESLNELATQYELISNLDMMSNNPDTISLARETDRVLQGLINSMQLPTK